MSRVLACFMIVGAGVVTAAAQPEIRVYFSNSDDTSVVPSEFVSQTVPAVELGGTAYLWAHLATPDTWTGIAFAIGFGGPVVGGQMYNPGVLGPLLRWDSASDLLFAGDDAVVCTAIAQLGLGFPTDPLQAPGGHYLLGEVTFDVPALVYLEMDSFAASGSSPANALVYFGFGDDPLPGNATGQTSALPDLYVGGSPGDPGACCVGELCEYVDAATCVTMGGTFIGENVPCSPDPCALGACCTNIYDCEVLTEADCLWVGGQWLGAGTDCVGNPCAPTGACCLLDGTCVEEIEDFCYDFDGIYLGTGTPCTPNACYARGDMNCDGALNAGDIDPFVLALTNPAQYAQQYPQCNAMFADFNGDFVVNAGDIDPFVVALTGGA